MLTFARQRVRSGIIQQSRTSLYAYRRNVNSSAADRPGIKPNMRVATLLQGRNPRTFTIKKGSTIDMAIGHLVENSSSASLVLDENENVIGLFTARDLLRFLHKGNRERHRNIFSRRIEDAMTPGDKVVS